MVEVSRDFLRRRLDQIDGKVSLPGVGDDDMSMDMDLTGERDLTDAKIAASEARTDAKFAELLGEIKLIRASTSGLKVTIIVTAIATVVGLLGVTVAIMAYGASSFYNGTAIRDMMGSVIAEHLAHVRPISPSK